MASLILRPVEDVSVRHQGNYAMINEEVADGDSTYIYQTISSSSSSNQQNVSSTFRFSQLPQNAKVNSAKLYVVVKHNDSGTDINLNSIRVQIGEYTSPWGVVSQSYKSVEFDLASMLSAWNKTIEDGGTPDITVTLTTKGSKSASKNNNYQIRVTQAYIAVEYEQSADDGSKIYWKVSGSWSEVTLYKKVNGAWQVVAPEDMPSGLWVKK